MRKTLGVALTAVTLMFGGAAVANATTPSVSTSPTTTLADNTQNTQTQDRDTDNTGLWGLAGLLGLIGLAGLKRRKDTDAYATTAHEPNTPRA
jgi:LPXTG-motif cell wall-anchored protein